MQGGCHLRKCVQLCLYVDVELMHSDNQDSRHTRSLAVTFENANEALEGEHPRFLQGTKFPDLLWQVEDEVQLRGLVVHGPVSLHPAQGLDHLYLERIQGLLMSSCCVRKVDG